MSDLTTLNNLFIEQYGGSTKFIQFVDGMLGIMQDKFIEPLDILNDALDLDNVEGILLDYIGIRLGFTRPTVTAAGEFFGFDTGQTDNNFGWNQRPFFTSIEVLQTKTPVSDDIYRTLLKARGRFIRSSPTYEDVEAILDILYGEGNWSITESTTGLSFVIRYSSSANSVIVSIVEANKQFLIPRSAGVACTVMSEFSLQVVMDMINVIGDVVDVTLPAASGGATPITYAVTGLPTGLSFDTTTRDITGTVGGTAEVSMVTYTATDDNGTVITRNFDWETEAANQPPVARAGADQTGVTAGATFTLDGSASSDPDGTIASQQWTQTAGDTVALADATALMTTGVAPSTNTAQTLTFSLVVTDDDGLDSVANTVDIGVLAIGGMVDLMPSLPTLTNRMADFNSSVDITLPVATGGDPPLTYSVSGLPGGLAFDTSSRRITGTPNMVESPTVTYSVEDDDGDMDDGTFVFEINAVIPGSPQSLSAAANGKTQIDLTIVAPSFTGGTQITGYRIDVSEDDSTFTTLVANNSGLTYSHTSLNPSSQRYYRVYAINSAGTSTGYAEANATTVANQPPVARAGSDQTGIVAGATVTLDSSIASSDPDGTSHANILRTFRR